MSSELYQRHALHCFRIAEGLPDSRNKTLLITMAQSWLRLAEQAEKNAKADLVYETPQRRNGDGARHIQQQQQQQQQQMQPKKKEG